ncbi:MAG: Gfo/Idh/MocA family oxidoreductase [Thermoproteota archaeon]
MSLYGYYYEMKHFAESLLKGAAPKADIGDGAKALEIAEAVWRSAKEGRTVEI